MEEKETVDLLNQVYRRLEDKGMELVRALRRGFEPKLAWYNGHYRRQDDGSFAMDHFPIPVVEVKGCCDIEINLDSVTVSARLRREDALSFSYEKLSEYEYEIYGVEDYLGDLYRPGMAAQELTENIRNTSEREISFSFRFDFDADGDTVYNFATLLHKDGFYN